MIDMPEILAIKKSKEMWAAYLCRSGKGDRDDTNYYREDYVGSLEERITKLEKVVEAARKYMTCTQDKAENEKWGQELDRALNQLEASDVSWCSAWKLDEEDK